MHSNSFRLQVLMSLLLSHLYACMHIIYMYDPPPNFDTNPRSKKKHKTLENTGQPHQTRVHGGGVPYIYIYTLFFERFPSKPTRKLRNLFLSKFGGMYIVVLFRIWTPPLKTNGYSSFGSPSTTQKQSALKEDTLMFAKHRCIYIYIYIYYIYIHII